MTINKGLFVSTGLKFVLFDVIGLKFDVMNLKLFFVIRLYLTLLNIKILCDMIGLKFSTPETNNPQVLGSLCAFWKFRDQYDTTS